MDEMDFHRAKALLEWQVELGATEAISDAPIDRTTLDAVKPSSPQTAAAAQPAAPAAAPSQAATAEIAVADARRVAAASNSLEDLHAALAAFEHCELKRGARNLVFADGLAGARLMILGEAPGRDEDIQGRPFVGRAGQLLDRMLAAIGIARSDPDPGRAVYITNVLPWRPPQNRDPRPDEIAMMLPFLERHIALARPEFLILMGNISCQAMLGRKGITRLRGIWTEAAGLPVLPMFHPAYLLRNPAMKRAAWEDLLSIQARLEDTG
ncbi:MAG: uracil-DNA glycosylase [Pseudomonadota bacterium]